MTKRHSVIILLVSGLLLQCRENEQPISFAMRYPFSGEVVWNTISVDFQLPLNFEGTVQLYANDLLLATSAVRNAAIEWDTRSVPDGPCRLRAVATSADGEESEAYAEVVVRNTLLQWQTPSHHLSSGQRAFIFLTDGEGKVIDSQEIENGEPVKMMGRDGFSEGHFMVNEAYLFAPGYVRIFSVRSVPRGSWTLNGDNQSSPTTYTIQVKTDPLPSSVYYVSASGDADFLRQENNGILLSPTQSPSRVFLREIGKQTNKYALVNGVSSGSLLTFPVSEITKPLKREVVKLADHYMEGGRIKLYGFSHHNQFTEHYPLGLFFRQQQQINLEYPENEFDAIGSESYYRTAQIRLYSFHPTKHFDIQTINAQVDMSSADGKVVNLATYGQFDVYATSWLYFDEETEASASWMIIGASGKSEVLRLPEVPDELVQLLSLIKFRSLEHVGMVQVSDYETTSYAEYLQLISHKGISAPYEFGRMWKEQQFTQSGFTGGRAQGKGAPMLVEALGIVD